MAAFSVDATVTRPAPLDTPIVTEGMWLPEQTLDQPLVGDLTRTSMHRTFCLDRSIGVVPRGTVIAAPEERGGTTRRWIVDGPQREEHDLVRVWVLLDERQ